MRGLFWIVAGLFLAGAAQAQDCALKRVAQFDMVDSDLARPVIEVKMDGRPVRMLVDTGAVWSGLADWAAEGLATKRIERHSFRGIGGGKLKQVAVVPEFDLGPVKFPDFQFLVFAPDTFRDPGLAGAIGANVLQKFDVEIDYRGRKVVFYSQDHCPGRVISWPHDTFARLAFEHGYNGPIIVPVKLDGRSLKATIDTGASESLIEDKLASDLFELTSESPGVEAAGTTHGVDGRPLTLYRHRFETLELDELKFPHPQIIFYAGRSEEDACIGVECGESTRTDMILGARHLRALHLFISYGERAVYATTAN